MDFDKLGEASKQEDYSNRLSKRLAAITKKESLPDMIFAYQKRHGLCAEEMYVIIAEAFAATFAKQKAWLKAVEDMNKLVELGFYIDPLTIFSTLFAQSMLSIVRHQIAKESGH